MQYAVHLGVCVIFAIGWLLIGDFAASSAWIAAAMVISYVHSGRKTDA